MVERAVHVAEEPLDAAAAAVGRAATQLEGEAHRVDARLGGVGLAPQGHIRVIDGVVEPHVGRAGDHQQPAGVGVDPGDPVGMRRRKIDLAPAVAVGRPELEGTVGSADQQGGTISGQGGARDRRAVAGGDNVDGLAGGGVPDGDA